ncbi:MAG: hypothetical protein ACFFDS_07520 [Candidatus Thorarchaeota archaeon]
MSSDETIPAAVLRQRRRYEALGVALNKSSGMKSWFKVLFIIALISGIPAIILLRDPLKDGLTTAYQMITIGSRIFIIIITLYLLMKIMPEIYTAKNDFEMKLNEVGYKDPNTNTKEEKINVYRKLIFTTLKLVFLVVSFFGLFLAGSRDNYGFIIGNQILYLLVIVGFLLTIKFWTSNGPENSPRMGGRNILQIIIPGAVLWGLEVFLEFFSFLSEPRFHFNTLQISWGVMYPFMLLFILIAVIYTTKKTVRERMVLQDAREMEFKRKESFIDDKRFYSRAFFGFQTRWNEFAQIFRRKDTEKVKDLDKKPNEKVVKALWITLFATFIPFVFILPWNFFPHDGIVIFGALMVAYQYSMIKYKRIEIEVISEPERDETITPTEIRKPEFVSGTLRWILIPMILFVIAVYLIGGVITSGILTRNNEMLILSFTWISVLIVIPLSIQIISNIKSSADENRTKENVEMHRNSLILILILQLVLIVGSIVGNLVGNFILNVEIIPLATILLQAAIAGVLVIIPLIYQFVIPKLTDENYKMFNIGTFIVVALADAGIIVWFIFSIIIRFFA